MSYGRSTDMEDSKWRLLLRSKRRIAAAAREFFQQSYVACVLLAFLSLWTVFDFYRPHPPLLTPAQITALEPVPEHIAQWTRSLERCGPTVFCTFGRDSSGAVSDPIRQAVERADRLDLLPEPAEDRIRRRIEWSRRTAGTRKDAVAMARRQGGTHAFWGKVVELGDVGRDGYVQVNVELVDVNTTLPIAARSFENRSRSLAPRSPSEYTREWFWPTRLLLWLAASIAWPWMTLPVSRRVVTRMPNMVIALLLAVLVMVSVWLSWWLIVSHLHPLPGMPILTGLGGAALIYDWYALALIRETWEKR